MSVLVDISHRLGDFAIDAVSRCAGRLTGIVRTLGLWQDDAEINMIAGLIRPDKAASRSTAACWSTPQQAFFVPKHKRRIGNDVPGCRGCFRI